MPAASDYYITISGKVKNSSQTAAQCRQPAVKDRPDPAVAERLPLSDYCDADYVNLGVLEQDYYRARQLSLKTEHHVLVEALFSRQREFSARAKTVAEIQQAVVDPEIKTLLSRRWEQELQELVDQGVIHTSDNRYYLTAEIDVSLADDPLGNLVDRVRAQQLTVQLGTTGNYFRFRGALFRAYQQARQQAANPGQVSAVERLYHALARGDNRENIFSQPEYAVSVDQLLLYQEVSAQRRYQLIDDLDDLRYQALITSREFSSSGLTAYRFPVNRPEKLIQ